MIWGSAENDVYYESSEDDRDSLKFHDSDNVLSEEDEEFLPTEENTYDEEEEGESDDSLFYDESDGKRFKKKFPEFMHDRDIVDPVLKVGMIFGSNKELKEACKSYGIANAKNIWFPVNDKKRLQAKCKEEGCPFNLWGSKLDATSNDDATFQIKTLVLNHTCRKKYNTKHISVDWLAKKYLDRYKADCMWSLSGLKATVKADMKYEMSIFKAWRVRNKALKLIEGDEKDQYKRIFDYKEEILRSNPGSTVVIEVDRGHFDKIYVCLAALKSGFKAGCRPIIGVDGCWLKGPYGGQLLAAVGIDPNDCIYPIAWCVVDKRNTVSWIWFLNLLAKKFGN